MSGAAAAAKATGKRMEYPYTWTAKFASFPWKFYFTKQWVWKTFPVGLALTSYMMIKISGASNSEGNVAKWKEIRRKEREHHDD